MNSNNGYERPWKKETRNSRAITLARHANVYTSGDKKRHDFLQQKRPDQTGNLYLL